MFRLALINPTTDPRHTEAMGAVARQVPPDGCEVTVVSPERGPTSIESEDALERHGMRGRCVAVEPLEISVADQGGHNRGWPEPIAYAGMPGFRA